MKPVLRFPACRDLSNRLTDKEVRKLRRKNSSEERKTLRSRRRGEKI